METGYSISWKRLDEFVVNYASYISDPVTAGCNQMIWDWHCGIDAENNEFGNIKLVSLIRYSNKSCPDARGTHRCGCCCNKGDRTYHCMADLKYAKKCGDITKENKVFHQRDHPKYEDENKKMVSIKECGFTYIFVKYSFI